MERKWWVAGIATIPTYLVIAIVIGQLGPLLWLAALVGAMFITGMLYRVFVFRLVKRGLSSGFVLACWVAAQFIGISILLFMLSN